MTIFVIIAGTVGKEALGAKVKELYKDSYELPPNAWFIADTITANQMRDKVGLTGDGLGAQGVVVKIDGYAGYAPSDLWEWLRRKLTVAH